LFFIPVCSLPIGRLTAFYACPQGVILEARPDSSTPASWISRLSAQSILQTLFVALALAGFSAATHGAAETDAGEISSDKGASTWFRFDFNKLDLNVYGLAYHPDRERVHTDNLDNEFNPGLGLHYELRNTERGITFAEAGSYYDSGSNWATFLALGYQWKWGERWRFGGAVAAMNSRTYNNGVAFIGMFPLVTYDMGPVKLNAVYFPKVANYNEVAAFGFYIGIPLAQWFGN